MPYLPEPKLSPMLNIRLTSFVRRMPAMESYAWQADVLYRGILLWKLSLKTDDCSLDASELRSSQLPSSKSRWPLFRCKAVNFTNCSLFSKAAFFFWLHGYPPLSLLAIERALSWCHLESYPSRSRLILLPISSGRSLYIWRCFRPSLYNPRFGFVWALEGSSI